MKTKPKFAMARLAGLWVTMGAWLTACTAGGDANELKFVGNVLGSAGVDICEFTVGDKFVTQGVMDLAVVSRYQMAAALENTMRASTAFVGANPNLRDTNAIVLDSALVQLSSSDPTIAGAWTKPSSGAKPAFFQVSTDTDAPKEAKSGLPPVQWVAPMTGVLATGALGLFLVDLVPTWGMDANGALSVPVGEQWQARFAAATSTKDFRRDTYVNLQVQFHGKTLAGSSITTVPVTFPLRVCWGCLLRPADTTGTGSDVWQSCSSRDATGIKPPCRVGQDDPTHCGFYCQACNLVSTPKYKTCDTTYCPL